MMMADFFLPQENAIAANAGHLSDGENVIKTLTKIYSSKPVFKMEFEHKPLIHVVTLCAASAVACAFLGCTTTLTVSFFQFCSQWINELILIAIILNEDDTIFRTAFSNFCFYSNRILLLSSYRFWQSDCTGPPYKTEGRSYTVILVSKDNTSSTKCESH